MKFTKTSSTINQKDLSLNFNISEISTILKETSIQEWELFLTCNTECVLLRILNYRLPISSFDFSKKTVICDFEECTHHHNMNIEYRKCCESGDCPVRYKIEYCALSEIVI